jgi:tetratricopeptide (TPR) repeat protein
MRVTADQGQWQECYDLAKVIAKANPEYPFTWLCLGWSNRGLGRPAEAIPAFEEAHRLGATNRGRIRYEIALCQAQLDRQQDCLASLQKALDEDMPSRAAIRRQAAFEKYRKLPEFQRIAGIPPEGLSLGEKRAFDAAYLAQEIQRIHPSPYQIKSKAEWDSMLAELKPRWGAMTEDELIVELKRIARLANDGHTSVAAAYEYGDTAALLPILFSQFQEGVYVTAAGKGFEDALWARVKAVDGRPIAKVLDTVADISPQDNAYRKVITGPPWLRHPQLLHALKLADSPSKVTLTLEMRDGKTVDKEYIVGPSPASLIRDPADGSKRPMHSVARSPFYSAHYLPAVAALWIHYNGCQDMDEESIADFAKRMDAFIKANDVKKLVIDLRWNGGGDNFLNLPLLELAMKNSVLNDPDHLFVCTSPYTFSAAVCFAGQLQRFTQATFVGQPTPSPANFIGESIGVPLPCTGIEATVSNLYWQNGPAMDAEPAIFPKVSVPYRFADYSRGRDACMEAILGEGFEKGAVLVERVGVTDFQCGNSTRRDIVGSGGLNFHVVSAPEHPWRLNSAKPSHRPGHSTAASYPNGIEA